MRLTDAEIAIIKNAASRHFGPGSIVRLFGSRVLDHARGGDIDLHIVATASDACTLARECDFREEVVSQIGEQRIDTIVQLVGFKPRPIDHIAMNEGIVL